jgi:hypothetical protein
MFCPLCQAEYREGITKCSDCRVDLVSSPEEAQSASVRLWKGNDQRALDDVLSALDSHEIHSNYEQIVNAIPGINVFGISLTPRKSTFEYEVRVLSSDLDRARSAIANLELDPFLTDPPGFGQARNRYQREWEAYRLRKRRLVVLLLAEFLGLFPFLLLVATIDRNAFSSTSLVLPAGLVWGALYMITGYRLRVFPCPRCGKNFFAGITHDPADLLTRPKAFLGRECVHCGLHKFAESAEDISQSALQEPEEKSAIAIPISGALRILLAGAIGTLVGLVISLRIPAPARPSVLEPPGAGPSGFAGYAFRLQHFLADRYFVLPCFLAMVYLAISKREQSKFWFYALLAGWALPAIVFHYVLHWN